MIEPKQAPSAKKEAMNLNLTEEIAEWLRREATRLMTSKAVVARLALEKAMRESEERAA